LLKFQKQQKGFLPTEIIFSATDACNLHCEHCFVSRTTSRLNIDDCKTFLDSCKKCEASAIEKVGFSGGEPFLYLDFLCQIISHCVKNDLMFDRLMTNGVWWNTESDLEEKLQKVYDAGFDGKIGLSWDAFHNQDFHKILTFITKVHAVFGKDRLDIQSVIKADDNFETELSKLSEKLDCTVSKNIDKKTGRGQYLLENDEIYISVYREAQTYTAEDKRAWNSKKWFKEDYCQGPGNILFVHPNGKIAPCCGFANEEEKLIIGNISQTLEEVLNQAQANSFVNLCYEKGLSTLQKSKPVKSLLKSKGLCKTAEECTFCQFISQNLDC